MPAPLLARHRHRPRIARTGGGLYAVGESACTGLHGATGWPATRCWSVWWYGEAAAHDIAGSLRTLLPDALPQWDESRVTDSRSIVISHNWDELRRLRVG